MRYIVHHCCFLCGRRYFEEVDEYDFAALNLKGEFMKVFDDKQCKWLDIPIDGTEITGDIITGEYLHPCFSGPCYDDPIERW